MRAFVITGPRQAGIQDVAAPVAARGEVVVDVRSVGVCGTDVEFYTGDMAYLHTGRQSYPVRIGHEWSGVVRETGPEVDSSWIGRRVTGDTILGCGVCRRCRTGYHYVCAEMIEIGISRDRPGALAERLAIPASALRALPDSVDDSTGAMVEPGGTALRAVRGAELQPGDRLLVLGAGTIGLLVALFARADGSEVHVVGRSARSLAFARSLGFPGTWTWETLPDAAWDSVIDASNAPELPARAIELVEPGKRVVCVGLAGEPSLVDTRMAALRDVTIVGILGGSDGLSGAIEQYAAGAVDPRPLIAATVPMSDLPSVLAGKRPSGASDGPKVHVSI
jgi:threonine dehydrogenase-like Zn-dependent dehydrogenase